MKTITNNRVLHVIAILLFPLVLCFALQIKFALIISLFVSVLLLWLCEVLPLGMTGLLIPCLSVIYGLQSPKDAFRSFGASIVFLFIAVFFLAYALEKTGLANRIVCFVLYKAKFVRTPKTVLIAISVIAWFLSMWMSNTAACAILIPLALGLIIVVSPYFDCKKEKKNFSTRLILTCTFAASVGGIATPIGTPPNLLALEYLAMNNIEVTFVSWFLIAFPLTVLMLILLLSILGIFFPVRNVAFGLLDEYLEDAHLKLGSLSAHERIVGLCFAVAVVLWVVPSSLHSLFPHTSFFGVLHQMFSLEIGAIIAAVLLFLLPATNSKEPVLDKTAFSHIDWNTIMLFGGGLCLGNLITETGLAREIGRFLTSSVGEFGLLLALAFCLLSVIMSEFSSNTASAAIVIPVVLGVAQFESMYQQSIMAIVFAASYGFMLPVSTAPNALAYGTGKVRLRDMAKAGFVFDILGAVLIFVYMFFLLPKLGIL